MVTTDAQAYFAVGLEAAVGRGEAEAWGSQGISWREQDAAVVEALAIDGVGRAAQSKVPFEEIGLEGLGRIVSRGRAGYLSSFSDCRRLSRKSPDELETVGN